MRTLTRAVSTLVVALATWHGLAAQEPAEVFPAEVFQGEAIEQFLVTARITRMRRNLDGVTGPRRATLELDGVSHDAVFKTVDLFRAGFTQDEIGTVDVDFTDQWQTEVAAYQIDRIIGLGMVPATVERTYRGERGSLQWWVESEMSEAERVQKEIDPPDWLPFILQGLKMQLFDELIYNTDRHLGNILLTEDFEVRLIDHSRSFRLFHQLKAPQHLLGFSRSLLAGLERLDREDLRARIGQYVSLTQIDAVLKRRDAILALAREMVAKHGEDAVLY